MGAQPATDALPLFVWPPSMSAEILSTTESTSSRTASPAWYALAGLLLAVIYSPTLRWLYDSWLNDRFYSHGFLVAMVCIWLVSQQWPQVVKCPVSPSPAGVLLVALGLLLESAGAISDIMTLSGISLVIVMAGLILDCRDR